VSILIDVLACVEDLAAAGTAHLNIKPANIFVTGGPADDRAVVLGFGTSVALLYTGAGAALPADDPHLAPELVYGEVLPLDEAWRSDLFSLGVVACSLLGADIETDGRDRPRVELSAAARAELEEVGPLEAVLGKILDPNPMRRASSPSELRDPLIRSLPVFCSDSAAGSVGAERPSRTGFDPNKTDPAFIPPEPESDGDATVVAPAEAVREAVGRDNPHEEADEGSRELSDSDEEAPCEVEEMDLGEFTVVDESKPFAGDSPELSSRGMGSGDPPSAPQVREGSAATVRRARTVPRWELALVSAVVLILAAVVAVSWARRADDRQPPVEVQSLPVETVTTTPLDPPPVTNAVIAELMRIQDLIESDQVAAARRALDEIAGTQGGSFSPNEAALFDSLVAAVNEIADRAGAVADLRGGLDHGSVRMIRRGVAGVGGMPWQEISRMAGLAEDLERGRQALALHAAMWEAMRGQDPLAAIEASGRLLRVLPGYGGAADVRREAAGEVERTAETLIGEHRFDEAITVYQQLARAWPERDGPEARIAWCESRIAAVREVNAVVEQALAAGDAGDPEAGLAILDRFDTAGADLSNRVERTRDELRMQLAELDADEPVVELAATSELAFKKNQTVTVPFYVTDDHRVEQVVAHARQESEDDYLEIPLKVSSDGLYSLTLTPELHGNQDVYFFIAATDSSGHIGKLGARGKPVKIERKRWLKKLLQ
jgi:hypothetical protein